MSRVLYFNSPEGECLMREKRIHEMPGVKDASAVHLVFDSHSVVVERGKLGASMVESRRLVHQFMEQHDAEMRARFEAGLPASLLSHATLSPITAKKANALRAMGVLMLTPAEYRAYHQQIVQTCYETVRDCPDPAARLQAACLLQSIGDLPEDMQ